MKILSFIVSRTTIVTSLLSWHQPITEVIVVSGFSFNLMSPPSRPLATSLSPSQTRRSFTCLWESSSNGYVPNPSDQEDSNSSAEENYAMMNDSFYRNLEQAKRDKLGADIPKEQLQASAQEAENEFLQAMKEARQQFQKAKAKLGSDGAVDLFLEKIQMEHEQQELEENLAATETRRISDIDLSSESDSFTTDNAFE